MQKGFTLIELLVVIAIIAVLATAAVLILNPAELIRQGRDSTRLADLSSVHGAIALYLSDQTPTWTATTTCTANGTLPFSGGGLCSAATRISSSTAVNGLGWAPVQFTSSTIGSPLSRLPLDPIDNATYFYAYRQTASLTYEIDANLESSKFANGGTDDKENTDGGDNANVYEIGNDGGLDL